jgi:hypothetical protein
MKSDGYVTPSTETLAFSGTVERSVSTIKRYLALLESLDLIYREYPTARTHVINLTEKGKKLFETRFQNPLILKGQIKIELLNKTTKDNSTTQPIYHPGRYKGTTEKPKLKSIHVIFLEQMIEKCTTCFENAKILKSEILFSILHGSLMCIKGTGTYHLIPNAIKIAMWLVKNQKWKTPNEYREMNETEIKKVVKNTKADEHICEMCGRKDPYLRFITTTEGPRWMCPHDYVRNLSLELPPFKRKLYNLIRHIYRETKGDPSANFDSKVYKEFTYFLEGKRIADLNEMSAFIEVEAVILSFFKYVREEIPLL